MVVLSLIEFHSFEFQLTFEKAVFGGLVREDQPLVLVAQDDFAGGLNRLAQAPDLDLIIGEKLRRHPAQPLRLGHFEPVMAVYHQKLAALDLQRMALEDARESWRVGVDITTRSDFTVQSKIAYRLPSKESDGETSPSSCLKPEKSSEGQYKVR